MNDNVYIVNIEGIDGAGKTTQIELLEKELSSCYNVVRLKQPGTTVVGNEIRQILKADETSDELENSDWAERLLFAADNACLIDNVFRQANPNTLFLCDRSNFISDIAYGHYGLGLNLDCLTILHEIIDPVRIIRDSFINIILDISFEEAKRRMTKRGATDRIENRG